MAHTSRTRAATDPDSITAAARILRDGGIVAMPTETVYGLAADATNARAVARIFEAKRRPAFNPLIVHVPDLAEAEALIELPPPLRALARKFWPGPLTLVARARTESGICQLVRAGLDTLAVRVPAASAAKALLRETGRIKNDDTAIKAGETVQISPAIDKV